MLVALISPPRQRRTSRLASSELSPVPLSAAGNDMRDAFELALDNIGRKMGGRPVTVIYEDDQLKPDVGKQKTEKLIQSDR